MDSPARCVMGFESSPFAGLAPCTSRKAAPARRSSLLSLRLLGASSVSTSTMSRVESSGLTGVDSYGDLAGLEHQGASCSLSLGSEVSQPSQEGEEEHLEPEGTPALDIPYTRAARARLDAAERQGKAFEQQLELLAAVRAYLAANAGPPQA
ncbi:hypothetical protein Rsub_12164 [Raphidocelis subcapitata]|uniref:Uncharacterized protein n=1 Tax=Raphidocelis subcapitata TaxID=307507 RepID=A0A2V0PN70_9CHLO|nr:hypothetical protein Rsub_12164 [Raphidocelis subcapitata]|eukprot:GBF99360.1 hypothetical protein Rsub_12164 [Raphidocelis subcapitata]